MSIRVETITTGEQLQQAFDIRIVVFVDEQKVPMAEEIDEFENDSTHLVAYDGDAPVGACRWRFTENGAKLERFAVLKSHRGKGVGAALVYQCMESIKTHSNYNGQKMYLHAQLDVCPLYKKFGFKEVGDKFMECDIKHIKMII